MKKLILFGAVLACLAAGIVTADVADTEAHSWSGEHRFFKDVDVRTDAGASLKLGGTAITATADEINTGMDGITASAAELNLLDGTVAGTAVAGKATALTAAGLLVVTSLTAVATVTVTGGVTSLGPVDMTVTTTADDWSVSHYSVTAGSGDNVRAFRATLTGTADSVKDLTAVHGRCIVPSSATIDATGNSIQSVFGWTQIGASLTAGAGTIICANRAILTGGANDLRNISGGGQSAIFYGQLWGDNSEIDSGIFFATGAANTIDSLIEVGGAATVGTIIDLTSGGGEKDTLLRIVVGGPMDSTETQHWGIFAGDSTDHATIHAEVGAASYGSCYFSTAGELFIKDGSGTWQKMDNSDD